MNSSPNALAMMMAQFLDPSAFLNSQYSLSLVPTSTTWISANTSVKDRNWKLLRMYATEN